MKFLVALTMLASVSAFAQRYDNEKEYKCWDTAQGERGYPTYVFEVSKENHYLQLELDYPRELYFERKHDCWVSKNNMPGGTTETSMNYDKFEVCEGEGQHINGLIPVEIDEEYFEGTVYCERGLKQIFKHDRHDN